MIRIGTLWAKFLLRLRGKAVRDSRIDPTARILSGCNVVHTQMGRYSFCGYDCWLINAGIGAFCSIGANVRIGGAAHPVAWVSTSPVFHSGGNVLKKHFSEHDFQTGAETKIGNDVWIGENALIKAGVTIGDGAVIGMGSVVTKDVGPYEIWAGNPAKRIRPRFDPALAESLLKSRWWDLPEEELSVLAHDITEPEVFLRSVQK